MFFILGISISVFLLFLLLIKKNKSSADKILLIWLLLLFVHQLFNYLAQTNEIEKYPHLLGVDFPFPVLQGVLLFMYVLTITGRKLKKRFYYILHFIPSISLVLLAIPFYSLSGAEKIAVMNDPVKDYWWYLIYYNSLMFISGLGYSLWSLYVIRKHQKRIQQSFSNTDKKELQWLQYLSIGLGIIWFIVLFADDTRFIFTGVVILVLFIGFFGINQMNIFQTNAVLESNFLKIEEEKIENNENSKPAATTTKRYAKSGLTEEMAAKIYTNLNELMTKESLFNDNDITLTELAKRLDVHPNHLSQVINEKEEKNFYNYINALRIKAFIKLASLPESKKYTLLSLAYDCGFNSKSTFNKHFKENTGKTPTEYFKS
ncbi:MAG: helix-turn-helix domain-containing protein [Saprospiraceae bacterium]